MKAPLARNHALFGRGHAEMREAENVPEAAALFQEGVDPGRPAD
jgi:hypothetical protein